MRCFVTALLIGLTVGTAAAQTRSSTQRMACAEAMEMVRRGGELVLPTGGPQTERIVRDRSYCELSEIAELRFVPTRDNPQCPIGYRCREPGFEEWNW